MKEYYDALLNYDELYGQEQIVKRDKLVFLFEKHGIDFKNKNILDVGCGTGIASFSSAVGVDPSETLIEINKQFGRNKEVYIGYAEDLPFPDNAFDIVISMTAMHNFEDIEKSIREMLRVGKEWFGFSILKRINTQKEENIFKLINKYFNIIDEVEDEKDFIMLCKRL